MDFVNEILPIVGGSVSIMNCLILFQIHNIKQEIDREKQNFLNFVESEKQQNQDLNKRLTKLEIQAARRWSTWRAE